MDGTEKISGRTVCGVIPSEISGCQNLSQGLIEGDLNPNLGSLASLSKFILRKNQFSGSIPSQLGSCTKLQLLDLGRNQFIGEISPSLGKILVLEITLNLSWNELSGKIPEKLFGLDKLGIYRALIPVEEDIKCTRTASLNAVPIVEASDATEEYHTQLIDGKGRVQISASDLRGCPIALMQSWLSIGVIEFIEHISIAPSNLAGDLGYSARELVIATPVQAFLKSLTRLLVHICTECGL
uniref:Uncharacterized protein n=1 Tax=Nelumbo nucifera TaxID=4432 RepID=A0A822XDA9_NELNU|nr:TPA_asm: hypothetical protein HUJ06_019773 [Nelumbo nucifera]